MYNDNSFGTLGGPLFNLSQNPLIQAAIQMAGNNSPRIGQLPNTMEGVPQILMASGQQQFARQKYEQEAARKRAAEEAEADAMMDAMISTGMEPEQAARYRKSPKAFELYQNHKREQAEAARLQQYRQGPVEDEDDDEGDPSEQAPTPGQVEQQIQQRQQVAPAPPPAMAPQQPMPAQPMPQGGQPGRPLQRPFQQTGATPDPEALKRALSQASSEIDQFGRAAVNKPVGEIARQVASMKGQTSAAVFVDEARKSGLLVDDHLSKEVLSNPVHVQPLARAAGIGADLSPEQWGQAHAAAAEVSRERQQRAPNVGPVAEQQQFAQRPPNAGPVAERQDIPPNATPTAGNEYPVPWAGAPRQAAAAPAAQAQPQEERAPVQGDTTRRAIIVKEQRELKRLERQLQHEEDFLSGSSKNTGAKKNAELKIKRIEKEIKEKRGIIAANKHADEVGVPVGQDVKKTEEERAKLAVEREGKAEGGDRVLKLLDGLEEKTKNPLFKTTTGPGREYASDAPMWNPARWVYEYTPLGPNEKEQAFLGQIKADAQAINSELQRSYLAGQGQVTEGEREQINKILGAIPGARSVAEAQGQIENVRRIIRSSTQGKNDTPQQGYGSAKPGTAPAAPAAPAGGPRKPLSAFN